MRTIRFRGFTKEQSGKPGRWVYGHLTFERQRFLIWKQDPNGATFTDRLRTGHVVHEGSIGQFTGCRDKEGRDIYEGDIMLLKSTYPPEEGIVEEGAEVEVSFDDGQFRTNFYAMRVYTWKGGNWDFVVVGNTWERQGFLPAANPLKEDHYGTAKVVEL